MNRQENNTCYIEIDDYSVATWSKIAQIIMTLSIGNLITKSGFPTPEHIKVFTKNHEEKHKLSIITETDTSIVEFKIILKLKNPEIQYNQLIYFFNLKSIYDNISLGFDLNSISKKRIEPIRYSLGQFFWLFKNKTTYRNSLTIFLSNYNNFQISKLPSKENIVLKKFSPLIEINKNSYTDLFIDTIPQEFIVLLEKIRKYEYIDQRQLFFSSNDN